MRAILEALALHPAADVATLKHFTRLGDDALRVLVASRPALDGALQNELFSLNSPQVNIALASNPDLIKSIADALFKDKALAATGYAHIRLDEGRFANGMETAPVSLAANPTLSEQMQQRLFDLGIPAVRTALAANHALRLADALAETDDTVLLFILAANPAVAPERLEKLAETGRCDTALAANPSSPPPLLERLYAGGDAEVLGALAANPATPVAILQQLQLDSRFERAVRSNEAFGRFIQRENIGWL